MRFARSIRQKLNFILAATTLLALLMAGLALVAIDVRSRLTAIEDDLVTQADILGLASSGALEFDDRRAAAENLSVLRAKPDVAAAAIYDAKGELFASYVTPGQQIELPSKPHGEGVKMEGEWVRAWRPVSGKATHGMVYVQARHELVWRALDYLGILTVILTSSLAAALLLSNRLQGMLIEPIFAITEVARRIQKGQNFELRAPRTSEDEIGELADVFNDMLDELGRRAQTLQQANEALRKSDERYQLAVRGSSAGLWDWDLRADTMFYSPRLRASLGYNAQEFPDVPASLGNIIHEEDREMVRRGLREHLSQDVPYQVECRLRLKSGEWRWFLVAGMAQKDATGRAFRMAGSIIDVTERKRVEQALQESNRAKDEFIATLAHELRNPLAPIRTGLQILKKDHGNGAPSERARETMERQLVHMIRLIDDLLDISRINSGKIRLEIARTRLAEAVESAVEISRPLLESKGHRLVVEMPPQDIELMADGTRIAQTLGNLLNNAAKYTPPGGHVRLRAWQEGAWAVVEVQDDGVGIPTDMIDKVFALFTQVGRTLDRAQGGLGIGLYLVRSLVELHGGSVMASSPGPGQGSSFTVRLPCLLQAAAPPAPASPAQAQQAAGPLKVLVVDDNLDAAETLSTVLEMTGRRTVMVHDGLAVLPAARDFGPDVVLLDIGLPGLSGYDVARQLRGDERFSRTVLIAVTGWGSEADRRRSKEAGFDEHLTKPVDLDALEPLLRKVSQAA